MYFCRLLSMLILVLFSSLGWSVSDSLLMPSGYNALPHIGAVGAAVEFRGGQPRIKAADSEPPRHYYPVSLNVAGVPVEAKQEIFEGGIQVLSFDLKRVQKVNDISGLSLSGFQQLVFLLSRSTKAAVMRFYPLTQMAEIEINQLRIEMVLPEGEIIRRDLPEFLSTRATYQLLQAVECALNTATAIGGTAACRGGTLEKLDENHVFFEASSDYIASLPEWQIQADSSEFVELILNSTTQLILTLNSHGAIIRGDVVTPEEPSDMAREKDDKEQGSSRQDNKGSSNNKDDNKHEDSTPPDPGENSSSSGGSGDGDGEKDPRKGFSAPVDDEENEEDEEDEEEDEEEESEEDAYWMLQSQLLDDIDRGWRRRSKHLHTKKDRSESQLKKLEKHTGLKADAPKYKSKPRGKSKR